MLNKKTDKISASVKLRAPTIRRSILQGYAEAGAAVIDGPWARGDDACALVRALAQALVAVECEGYCSIDIVLVDKSGRSRRILGRNPRIIPVMRGGATNLAF